MQENNFWIGATDEAREGDWFWINYESVEMGTPFWGQTNGVPEPEDGEDGNCAVLYAHDRHYFHDGACYDKFGLQCAAVPIPSTSL